MTCANNEGHIYDELTTPMVHAEQYDKQVQQSTYEILRRILQMPKEDLKKTFSGACENAMDVLSVPPASEKTTENTEIVLDFATVKKKMELAEKILELDRKIARLDNFIRDIGDDEKKTCSMVFTCDTVMPFTDIDLADAKSMLRKYRDNLRIKLDTLWNEFATIDPYKMKEAE